MGCIEIKVSPSQECYLHDGGLFGDGALDAAATAFNPLSSVHLRPDPAAKDPPHSEKSFDTCTLFVARSGLLFI